MTRSYQIQALFGKTWIITHSFTRHNEALHFVKEHTDRKYPLRIVRVVKTVVFEEKK